MSRRSKSPDTRSLEFISNRASPCRLMATRGGDAAVLCAVVSRSSHANMPTMPVLTTAGKPVGRPGQSLRFAAPPSAAIIHCDGPLRSRRAESSASPCRRRFRRVADGPSRIRCAVGIRRSRRLLPRRTVAKGFGAVRYRCLITEVRMQKLRRKVGRCLTTGGNTAHRKVSRHHGQYRQLTAGRAISASGWSFRLIPASVGEMAIGGLALARFEGCSFRRIHRRDCRPPGQVGRKLPRGFDEVMTVSRTHRRRSLPRGRGGGKLPQPDPADLRGLAP